MDDETYSVNDPRPIPYENAVKILELLGLTAEDLVTLSKDGERTLADEKTGYSLSEWNDCDAKFEYVENPIFTELKFAIENHKLEEKQQHY